MLKAEEGEEAGEAGKEEGEEEKSAVRRKHMHRERWNRAGVLIRQCGRFRLG